MVRCANSFLSIALESPFGLPHLRGLVRADTIRPGNSFSLIEEPAATDMQKGGRS